MLRGRRFFHDQSDGQHRQQQYGTGCAVYRGQPHLEFCPRRAFAHFFGGRLRAGLQVAQANQRIALAQYEKTVQTAFREVADVLADRDQWGTRLGAQNGVVQTAQKVQALSEARFDAGADDFLTVLDARRSLYAAQQVQISLQLAEQQNRITLWKVLGGQALPAE